MSNPLLHNPHFSGEAFALEASGPAASGKSTAALLFHGFTATCFEVAHLGQRLNQAGYTVSGPLLPGHGTRPEDLNRTRWQDWAAAAEEAYAGLARRCERVIVGGESNGALLALYLAQRHPEIAAVLAFAPALVLPLTGFQRVQMHVLAQFLTAIPKGDLSGNTTWQGYKVNPLKALIQLTRFQKVVRGRLADITAPILIVQGRNDRTIDPRGAEMLFQAVSSKTKRLHWLENSGHCVLLEGEQDAAETLAVEFLQGIGV